MKRLKLRMRGSCELLPDGNYRHRGFSLVEVAIALVIFALLVGGLLVPLSAQVEQRRIVTTQKQLEEIKAALMGFAAANGRLPCPYVPGGPGAINGRETFNVGGTAANGICFNFFGGFLPAVDLGLSALDSQGFALDAWGLSTNRIRYAVTDRAVGVIGFAFTRTNGIRDGGGIGNIGTVPALHVCSGNPANPAPCNGGESLSSSAVVVIYSLGANTAPRGLDEGANLDNNVTFVSRERAEGGADPFDDLVTWFGSSLLVNRMIEAGRLP